MLYNIIVACYVGDTDCKQFKDTIIIDEVNFTDITIIPNKINQLYY